MISGFHHGANEIFALLEPHTEYTGSLFLMYSNNISVPSTRIKTDWPSKCSKHIIAITCICVIDLTQAKKELSLPQQKQLLIPKLDADISMFLGCGAMSLGDSDWYFRMVLWSHLQGSKHSIEHQHQLKQHLITEGCRHQLHYYKSLKANYVLCFNRIILLPLWSLSNKVWWIFCSTNKIKALGHMMN